MLWRHLIGYLPVNAVQGLVSVATIVLLTRLLEPEAYGRYALVLATTQLVHMSFFTWLHASMARFYQVAQRDGQLGQHFTTGYIACFVVAILVGGIYAAIVMLADFDGPIRSAFLFGLAMLLPRAILMMGLETHRAAGHVATYGTLEIFHTVGALILGVALILWTDIGEAGPFLGGAIVSCVCLAIDLPRIVAMSKPAPPSTAELRQFAAYGIPVSLMLALTMVFAVSDRFLIGFILGEAEVGVYAAGYQIASRTMDILFAWLGMAAMPLVIAAYEREGTEAARAIARRNAETMILIGFPAAAGLALVAEPLAAIMVGAQFRAQATMIVPWVALSSLMYGVTCYYVHHAFVLARRTGVLAALTAVPAGLNIGLNLLLIPSLGLKGALIATVLAYAVALGLCTAVGLRFFPLPIPSGAIFRGALATGGMALLVYLVPTAPNAWSLIAKMAAGVLAYVPLALLFDIAGCRRWVAGWLRRPATGESSG